MKPTTDLFALHMSLNSATTCAVLKKHNITTITLAISPQNPWNTNKEPTFATIDLDQQDIEHWKFTDMCQQGCRQESEDYAENSWFSTATPRYIIEDLTVHNPNGWVSLRLLEGLFMYSSAVFPLTSLLLKIQGKARQEQVR